MRAMKKFIIYIILFACLILVSIYLILSKADGYSDPYYLKFTTPRQNSLIVGTSKAAQGIIPDVASEILGVDIYNYSFNMNISPYGPKYLESIKRKLDKNARNGIFIITVDCWSISVNGQEPEDSFIFSENKSCIGQIDIVDKKPNFQYLLRFMYGNYYRILFRPSDARLHDNGWLEVLISADSASVNRRTKSTLAEYKNYPTLYKYSQTRFEYLVKTIEFLSKHGKVYLVRLPVSQGLMEVENKLMPDFDFKIEQISNKTCGYLNMTSKNQMYYYIDGVHLEKNSAKIVTAEIANWIREFEK